MKSLMIGQVSKEYGASETTGAALVAIELAKQSNKDFDISLYATNISNQSAIQINDFKVYGYSKNWSLYIWELVKHPIKGIKHLLYYKRKMGVNPLRFFFYEVNIKRTIGICKPNIIHTHGLTQYMPAYYAAEGKVPIVATLHGYWHTDEKGDRIDKATMPYVNNITTLTTKAMRDIIHDFPKEYNHFDIVSNGADTSKFFFSENKREEMRNKLAIEDRTLVFITVASIQERKGQLKFIQYLKNSGLDNYRYLIIGNGDENYVGEIRQFVADNGMAEKVSFIGYVNNTEMYSYYSAADFYAHVSTFEGQSLSEMEAASTGVRVIVNRPLIDTLPDNIIGTNTMYYVLDFNDCDYYGFLNWINIDIGKRQSVTYYSWQHIVERYLAVFKSIISNISNSK